jgi:hypothetical protein
MDLTFTHSPVHKRFVSSYCGPDALLEAGWYRDDKDKPIPALMWLVCGGKLDKKPCAWITILCCVRSTMQLSGGLNYIPKGVQSLIL